MAARSDWFSSTMTSTSSADKAVTTVGTSHEQGPNIRVTELPQTTQTLGRVFGASAGPGSWPGPL